MNLSTTPPPLPLHRQNFEFYIIKNGDASIYFKSKIQLLKLITSSHLVVSSIIKAEAFHLNQFDIRCEFFINNLRY